MINNRVASIRVDIEEEVEWEAAIVTLTVLMNWLIILDTVVVTAVVVDLPRMLLFFRIIFIIIAINVLCISSQTSQNSLHKMSILENDAKMNNEQELDVLKN